MLTKAGHGQSLPRKPEGSFVARMFNSNDRHSLRLHDAPMGAAGFGSIVAGVLVIRLLESFGGQRITDSRVLSIVVLFFAPAMLAAIYSLVFEKSKLYGSFDLAFAGIVLRMLPFTWHWMGMYLPFACAFTGFCAVVRLLGNTHGNNNPTPFHRDKAGSNRC